MAASVVPREVAFAVCRDSATQAAPSRDDVARVAKWFAGHVDLVKAGTKGSRGPGFEPGRGGGRRCHRRGNRKARGATPAASSSSTNRPTRTDGPIETRHVAEQNPPRHQPPPTPDDDDDDDPDARRKEAIEAAHERSRTGPAFDCASLSPNARRREEAAALFVSAVRGLGCEARTCVALTPVPLRASAASLERAGILLPQPDELWTVDGVSRQKSKKAKIQEPTPRPNPRHKTETTKAKNAKTQTEQAPGAETNAAPTRFAEPVTHWAEEFSVTTRSGDGEWVTVVPHSARGRRESNERWSFRSGRVRGRPRGGGRERDSPVMPYVFGFRVEGSSSRLDRPSLDRQPTVTR